MSAIPLSYSPLTEEWCREGFMFEHEFDIMSSSSRLWLDTLISLYSYVENKTACQYFEIIIIPTVPASHTVFYRGLYDKYYVGSKFYNQLINKSYLCRVE